MSKVEKFKITVGLSEKIPTAKFGNIDLGPYQIEFETILDKPLENGSVELQHEMEREFSRAKERVEEAYAQHREFVSKNIDAFKG